MKLVIYEPFLKPGFITVGKLIGKSVQLSCQCFFVEWNIKKHWDKIEDLTMQRWRINYNKISLCG